MKISDIKVERGSAAVADIALWGCGSLKILIDSLYDKAGKIDEFPKKKNKGIVDQVFAIASLLETQTAAIRSKLRELEGYFVSLERKRKEVKA